MQMQWYVAKILLLCRVDDDREGPWTCEEQIRVLRAADKEVAYEKALNLGRMAEHSYKNALGQTVAWEFLGLSNMDELLDNDITDGSEITARLLTASEPEQLVRNSEDFVMNWMPQEDHKTARDIIAESDKTTTA